MTTVDNPIPLQDLSGIVGCRFIYTYANGWRYEMYVKNDRTIDYRIHSGHVGGRWVKGQEVDLVQLDDDSYKISWTEPTGTSVVVNVMPGKRRIHGVIFSPSGSVSTASERCVSRTSTSPRCAPTVTRDLPTRSSPCPSSPTSHCSSVSAPTTNR